MYVLTAFCLRDPILGAPFSLGNEELGWSLGKIVRFLSFIDIRKKIRGGLEGMESGFEDLTQIVCFSLTLGIWHSKQVNRRMICLLYKTIFKDLKSSIYMKWQELVWCWVNHRLLSLHAKSAQSLLLQKLSGRRAYSSKKFRCLGFSLISTDSHPTNHNKLLCKRGRI